MFRIGQNEEIPYQEFKEYLEEGTSIYLDEGKMKKALEILEVKLQSRFDQVSALLFGVNRIKPHSITKYNIIDYHIGIGVPEEYFCRKGSEPKYYDEKIRLKIVSSGYLNDVLILYQDYLRVRALRNQIEKLLSEAWGEPRYRGNDGSILIKVNYTLTVSLNQRFNAKDKAVITFRDELQQSIASLEDYYIMSCDFPQIDAKAALNLYLRNEVLDKVINETDDTYLAFKEHARHIAHEYDKLELANYMEANYYVDVEALEERIKNYNSNLQPFSSTDIRSLYKVTALKTLYNSKRSVIPEENKMMQHLRQAYNTSVRYKRIKSVTRLLYNYNIPIKVRGKWGHVRQIVDNNFDAILNSVYNAPPQTTSSQIIIFYVVNMVRYFRSNGHGVSDFRVCMNRHDEPVFYIKKDVYKKHIRFISEQQVYLVEGWKPFQLELFVGHHYKQNQAGAIQDLKRVPSTYEQALLESKAHRRTPEVYPLVEPEIITLAYRKMKDGKMKVAFVRQVGPIPDEISLDNYYEDSRNYQVKLVSFDTDKHEMDSDLLHQVAESLIGLLKTDNSILLFNPIGITQDSLLSGSTVHFRSAPSTRLDTIAQAVLIAMAAKTEPERLPANYKSYIEYLDNLKERIV